jgi:N-glycosylase/DNA lyase
MDNGKLSIKKKLLEKGTPHEMREWLVSNLKGIGYKEASHFLRNIGFGKDIAILDRHILKNLKKHGVIREVPKTLTPKKYKEIENQMRDFSRKVRIPIEDMDLLFWSEETGEVFK